MRSRRVYKARPSAGCSAVWPAPSTLPSRLIPRHVTLVRKWGTVDWISLLRRLQPALTALTEPWVITGSAAFAAQGFPVEVHDLDIQTTSRGARLLGAWWRHEMILPVALRETGSVRSVFGRFTWPEGAVEVMGDIEHRRADGTWAAPPPLHILRRHIRCRGLGDVPVLPLRYEAEAYRLMNRPERAAELLAWAEATEVPEGQRGASSERRADLRSDLRSRLAEAAYLRGLIPPGTVVDAPLAFRLVRDLPYRRPSDNRPRTLIDEWRGTCSGKHRLLAQLLSECGYRTRLMIATYFYRLDPSGKALPELTRILEQGPVPDVHNFLEVGTRGGRWVAVDATWPAGAEVLGFAVNEAWDLSQSQQVACLPPFHAWEIPPGVDPDRYKANVVRMWCGDHLGRREALIQVFAEALRDPPPHV